MEYSVYRFKDICQMFAGGDAPTFVSSSQTIDSCYPIFSNGIDNEGLYGYCDHYSMPGNTLTISARGTVGKVFYRSEPFLPIVRLVSMIFDETIVNTKYMYYLLCCAKIDGYGTSQQQITIPYLKNKRIQIVSNLNTQKRIAEILSSYDNLIEVNNKRIKVLEQMAENLYKEWFIRFRFPGHETAEFENGIPKGWITKPLNEWMVESFNGGWGEEIAIPKMPNEAAVIRGTDIEDVKASRYCDVPLRYHKENDIKTKLLKENDIILELSNGNINNIGRTLYITKEILSHFDKVICASFCKTLRFSDVRVAFFVWQYIEYLQNSGMMFFYKNTGANGINNFNFKRFLRMQISIPTDGEKLEILLKIHNEISVIREKIFNLITQRDLLLPRLMSGKLEV